MSRYYMSDQIGRTNDSRQNISTNRISLPEFIPFTNEHENKDQNDKSIPPPQTSSRIQHQTRSPLKNFRNLEQTENRSPEIHRRPQNGNGRERRSSRESFRSNNSYDGFKHGTRNRSRSRTPQRRNESPPRRNESPPRRNESPLRRNGASRHSPRDEFRERSHQTSVFDRMSSPPLQRRKHETGMRRSNEPSSSNGHLPSHLFRTVSSHTMYEDAAHGNVEEVRYERGRSPYELQRRYVAEPMARHLIIDESVEMRNLRERLSAAETHCFGLETTVRSYEREIQKLRVIVNSLIDDFEVVQSRNFR